MLERSIYLNAWDEDVNYEIIITMMDSPLEDYNQFSDTTLSALASAMAPEYENAGIDFLKSEIYQHNQAKFIKMYISQPNNGSTAYGLQYHTVYDGKAINITLQSYSGKIDSNKESIVKKIIISIHFDTAPQFASPPASTDAFEYTDPNSGITFTVPENWVESPLNEEGEFIEVKFASNLEEGLCILFGSVDLFSSSILDEADIASFVRLMISRSDLDNSAFTKADVATMLGGSEKDVSMVTYGEKEYFLAETVVSGTVYGVTLSMPTVFLLRCENGYMYVFQFNGPRSSEYFQDFISLVSSAQYPAIKDSRPTQGWVIGIVVLVVLVALVAVFLFLKRLHKTRKQLASPLNPTPVSIFFCHKCGSKIAPGGRFCHKCGATLPTEEEKVQ